MCCSCLIVTVSGKTKQKAVLPPPYVNVHLGDHSEKAGLCPMSRGNVKDSYALEALALARCLV